MTTREWHEADQDDSNRVRSWPAQDAQEGASEDVTTILNRVVNKLTAQLWQVTAERDEALADIRELRSALAVMGADFIAVARERNKARTALSEAAAEIIRLNADDRDDCQCHGLLP